MEKKLDFKYPIITTYTTHAHMLGILGADEKTLPWIFSNYIQVYINKKVEENRWGDFYFPMPYEIRPAQLCKWLITQTLSDEFVGLFKGGIINFILESINKDSYVNLMVNYKYISGSYANKTDIDMIHDLLIIGYDDERRVFYCTDFVYEKNDKYMMFESTFDDLEKGYRDYYEQKKDSYFGKNVLFTYKLQKQIDYEYSPRNIYNSIKVYLNSETPEYWILNNVCNEEKIVFGIDYYDALIEFLVGRNYKFISIRLLYLMFDHKQMMIKRLEFLQKKENNFADYIEEYKGLSSEMNKIVNLALKYNVTHIDKYINSIAEKLRNVKDKEKALLTDLLSSVDGDI